MTRTPSVVLVDDTPSIRDLLRVTLEPAGFEIVGEAGDGAAGVDLVAKLEPDVVLLDISMPVMDGLHALPLMRATSPGSVILILTGFDGPPVRQALALGAAGAIQKASGLGSIAVKIRSVLPDAAEDDPQVTEGVAP